MGFGLDQHTSDRFADYGTEYHPFRLPVPGLWLDVFQKIRSLGYTGVSIYTDWALVSWHDCRCGHQQVAD